MADPTTAWKHPGFLSNDPDGAVIGALEDDGDAVDLLQINRTIGQGHLYIQPFSATGNVVIRSADAVPVTLATFGSAAASAALELTRATGTATPNPVVLKLHTASFANDWSTTLNWGAVEWYMADSAGVGGSVPRASVGVGANHTTGSLVSMRFGIAGPSAFVTALTIEHATQGVPSFKFNGQIVVGGNYADTAGLYVRTLTTVGVMQYGVISEATFTSSATTWGIGVYSMVRTAAAAFTMGGAYAFYAANPAKGAGSSITTAYGLYVEDLTAGTTNYAIYTAGTSNLHRFGGNLGVGGNPATNTRLAFVGTLASPGTEAYAIRFNHILQVGANSASIAQIMMNSGTVSTGGFTPVEVYGIHLRMDALTYSTPGGGTFSRTTGIFVRAATAGTNNFAIHVEQGMSYFEGIIQTTGAVTFISASATVQPGMLARNAIWGMMLYGVGGSSANWTMMDNSGNAILYNAAGSSSLVMGGNLIGLSSILLLGTGSVGNATTGGARMTGTLQLDGAWGTTGSQTLTNSGASVLISPAATTAVVWMQISAATDLVGITGGWEGRRLILVNGQGTYNLNLQNGVNNNGNDFLTASGLPVTIRPRGNIELLYLATRWLVIEP